MSQDTNGDIVLTVPSLALEFVVFDFTVVTYQYRRGDQFGTPCRVAFYNPFGSFDPYDFVFGP